jgi:hypothetical protein
MKTNPSYDPRQAQGHLSPDEPVGQPQSSRDLLPLEKPDGWIVRNRTGGVELFLDHERATAAFSAWGSSIGPLYAGLDTRPLHESKK